MTDTLTAAPTVPIPVAGAVPTSPASGSGVAPGPNAGAASGTLPRLYLTSDLRAATGLSRTHMDFYLREGIVVPTARTESGFLLFDERELQTLRTVLAWRRDGVGIKEIRQRLGR
jgi:hypothetical protein